MRSPRARLRPKVESCPSPARPRSRKASRGPSRSSRSPRRAPPTILACRHVRSGRAARRHRGNDCGPGPGGRRGRASHASPAARTRTCPPLLAPAGDRLPAAAAAPTSDVWLAVVRPAARRLPPLSLARRALPLRARPHRRAAPTLMGQARALRRPAAGRTRTLRYRIVWTVHQVFPHETTSRRSTRPPHDFSPGSRTSCTSTTPQLRAPCAMRSLARAQS